MKARRASARLLYDTVNISKDIAPFLKSLTFSDNFEQADDLQVTLADPSGLWRTDWYPTKGAALEATILQSDWDEPGDTAELYCGQFFIDEITAQGPDETVTIKARSVPVGTKEEAAGGEIMRRDKNRTWENTTLKTIAAQIADEAKLELHFKLAEDILYKSRKQEKMSDLAFLQRLGYEDGGDFRVKVSDKKLVIASAAELEKDPPVAAAERAAKEDAARVVGSTVKGQISSWSFTSSANQQYRACTVSYYDAEAKQTYRATVQADDQETGQTLILCQRAESQADAERIARARLRQATMGVVKGDLAMIGDIRMVAGVNIDVKGFGMFDGKYFIDSATHTVDGSGGYKTSLRIHRGQEAKK